MDWLQKAVASASDAAPMTRPEAPATVPGRVLHVDGDYLAYWAGGNDSTSVQTSRNNALGKIESMRVDSGSERVVVHLTADGSHKANRFIIATLKPYQGQRKSGRKPRNHAYLREVLLDLNQPTLQAKVWGAREADDGMAFVSRQGEPDKVVIATRDKDMRMLAGWHIEWTEHSMTYVAPDVFSLTANELVYGPHWFWLQLLQGDTADNIPGLPRYVDANGKEQKIADKTAAKFLSYCTNNEEAYAEVISLYRSYYGDDAEARLAEQALLLWLRGDHGATEDDVFTILPRAPKLLAAVNDIKQRIEDAKREALSVEG
jgi:DNA polymerase-1